MLNPYIWILLLAGAIGLFGTGASVGYKWSERAHGTALAAAQNKAIDDANTAVDLAIERTLASAKKETAARLAAREIRHRGELDAAKKSRPECGRDSVSIGLLHDAIDSANDQTPTTSKLPDEVRPPAETGGWFRKLGEAVGIRPDRSSGSVPADARGLRGVGE